MKFYEAVEAVEALDLKIVPQGLLKSHVEKLLVPLMIHRFPLEFTTLWRARPSAWRQLFQNVRELWYPPDSLVQKFGRANLVGNPVFYCSDHPYTALIESKGSLEEPFTIVACKQRDLNHPLQVVALGMGRSREERDGRQIPAVFSSKEKDEESILAATSSDLYLKYQFTRKVPAGEEHLYRITASLAQIFLDSPCINGPPTDGIAYSPVDAPFGANLALSKRAADFHLEPTQCWVVFVASHPQTKEATVFYLARSTNIAENGDIDWEFAEPTPLLSPASSSPDPSDHGTAQQAATERPDDL